MMDWLSKLWVSSDAPDEPDEQDRFYDLEQAVREAIGHADAELQVNPYNHHLKCARNYLSDAYIALWRASQKHHREAG